MFENNLVIKQSVGATFFNLFLLEPSFSFGKMYDFSDFSGTAVFNGTDSYLFRAETMMSIFLFRGKFNVFVNYQYNRKQNSYILNNQNLTKNYINQSITGGIKWNF